MWLLHTLLEGAELARARLAQCSAAQRRRRRRELRQRLHVELVRPAAVRRLEEEEHAVKRRAVDVDDRLARAALVAHRPREGDAGLEQPAVHREDLPVARLHQDRVPGRLRRRRLHVD